MYLSIFKRILNLLQAPKNEWQAIEQEGNDQNTVLSNFTLPLFGMIAGAVFVRQMWMPDFTLNNALKVSTMTFGTLLACVFIIFWISLKLFAIKLPQVTKNEWFAMAAYTTGIYSLAELVAFAWPTLFLVRIAAFASGYAAWHWTKTKTAESTSLKMSTAILTVVVLAGTGTLFGHITTLILTH